MPKSTIILIHGAWCGGWCFDKLRPLLETAGYTVIAPDMPGHGEDAMPIEEQNLETYARAVEDLIAPLSDSVVLVGHSFGGMIISQAACYIPDKIKKLVYIAAFLPQNGQSCLELSKSVQPSFREKLAAAGQDIIISADRKTSTVAADACADFVFSDISRDAALLLAKRLCPESNTAQNQAVVLNTHWGGIPKAYVRCTLDKVVDIKLQDKMLADTRCSEVYTLETGHCPFESDPRGLADILLTMKVGV